MTPDTAKTNNRANSRKALKKQGGFTLIEVLIALTIFAVGLLAIAAMQTSAIRMNSTAGHLTDLSSIGMDQLEYLMGLSITDPWLDPLGNPPGGTDPAGHPHQFITNDGFTVSWVTLQNPPVGGTPVPNTTRITLTVTGKGKRLTLTCLKARSL
ncbi:MAG: prepilin-type N-terminal cleavage/methylation domain-containing protein [Desulfobacterales bacterium]|jgi:type IV pilus assembly protein PilV